jgi:hypothetical protein
MAASAAQRCAVLCAYASSCVIIQSMMQQNIHTVRENSYRIFRFRTSGHYSPPSAPLPGQHKFAAPRHCCHFAPKRPTQHTCHRVTDTGRTFGKPRSAPPNHRRMTHLCTDADSTDGLPNTWMGNACLSRWMGMHWRSTTKIEPVFAAEVHLPVHPAAGPRQLLAPAPAALVQWTRLLRPAGCCRLQHLRRARGRPHSTGAGGDNGMDHNQN